MWDAARWTASARLQYALLPARAARNSGKTGSTTVTSCLPTGTDTSSVVRQPALNEVTAASATTNTYYPGTSELYPAILCATRNEDDTPNLADSRDDARSPARAVPRA